MSTLTITVAGTPPSPNEIRRWHWAKRAAEMKVWRESAWKTAVDQVNRTGWKTVAQATIEITLRVTDHQRRDPDNAVGAVKPLIDGLVDAHVIRDDSFAVIDRLSIGVEYGKVAEVVIRVIA